MSPLYHTFDPIYTCESRVLILGSFPSVASREVGFYYGNPRNRFWELIARIVGCDVPTTLEEKRELLISNGIALWDVCASCEIVGSKDSSIENAIPNDIYKIINTARIEKIFTNGAAAGKLFSRFFPELKAHCLPSTSPANAAYSMERLARSWAVLGDSLR